VVTPDNQPGVAAIQMLAVILVDSYSGHLLVSLRTFTATTTLALKRRHKTNPERLSIMFTIVMS
jgi:hypothetical protein